MFKTEADLVTVLRDNVPVLWGDNASSMVEVRCHDQASMDVLVHTPSALVAVEAKLSDWARVVAQAYLHRYCVDYVYVAIPADRVTGVRLKEAARFGLGVIAVDGVYANIEKEAARARPAKRIRQRLVAGFSD